MSEYAFNDVKGIEINRIGIFDQVDEIKIVVDDVCNNNSDYIKILYLGLSTKNSVKKIIIVKPPDEVYIDDGDGVSIVFIE